MYFFLILHNWIKNIKKCSSVPFTATGFISLKKKKTTILNNFQTKRSFVKRQNQFVEKSLIPHEGILGV